MTKKILLLCCLLPSLIVAQDISRHKFPYLMLNSRNTSEPVLRLDPNPFCPLDSTYMWDKLNDRIIAKFTYIYDDSFVMERIKTGYSDNKEVYRMKTTYKRKPERYYFWYEQIDSVFEQNKYVQKSKYTRQYNDKNYLTEYKEYESISDSPWGDPLQIYAAVEFNEENLPVIFMDTTYVHKENSDLDCNIHKWEITYGTHNVYESFTCYSRTGNEWIPEVKYTNEYDIYGFQSVMEVWGMEDNEWKVKLGEIENVYDAGSNKSAYIERDKDNEYIYDIYFEHFYHLDDTHNQEIKPVQTPVFKIENSSRILTVNLLQSVKGKLTITNATGKTVHTQSLQQLITEISLAHFKPGYYIINIQTPTQLKSQSIILK